jgi:hypothetical protein
MLEKLFNIKGKIIGHWPRHIHIEVFFIPFRTLIITLRIHTHIVDTTKVITTHGSVTLTMRHDPTVKLHIDHSAM